MELDHLSPLKVDVSGLLTALENWPTPKVRGCLQPSKPRQDVGVVAERGRPSWMDGQLFSINSYVAWKREFGAPLSERERGRPFQLGFPSNLPCVHC